MTRCLPLSHETLQGLAGVRVVLRIPRSAFEISIVFADKGASSRGLASSNAGACPGPGPTGVTPTPDQMRPASATCLGPGSIALPILSGARAAGRSPVRSMPAVRAEVSLLRARTAVTIDVVRIVSERTTANQRRVSAVRSSNLNAGQCARIARRMADVRGFGLIASVDDIKRRRRRPTECRST